MAQYFHHSASSGPSAFPLWPTQKKSLSRKSCLRSLILFRKKDNKHSVYTISFVTTQDTRDIYKETPSHCIAMLQVVDIGIALSLLRANGVTSHHDIISQQSYQINARESYSNPVIKSLISSNYLISNRVDGVKYCQPHVFPFYRKVEMVLG